MDCSPPGHSVHGIFQAGILEWVAISFSRGSSWPRDRIPIFCIGKRILTIEPPGKHLNLSIPIIWDLELRMQLNLAGLRTTKLWANKLVLLKQLTKCRRRKIRKEGGRGGRIEGRWGEEGEMTWTDAYENMFNINSIREMEIKSIMRYYSTLRCLKLRLILKCGKDVD